MKGGWWRAGIGVGTLCATLSCAVHRPPSTVHRFPDAERTIGVVVLAHGGSRRWNQTVRRTVAQAKLSVPTEVVFGMGMHPHEVDQLQQAVERLERRGARRLVVVPLLISSSSEVMRQFQYLFGLREHGPWEAMVRPLTLRTPILMTGPLEDDPAVAEVLVERAQRLSRSPQEEAVVLVAHGPTSDDDDARWHETMERLAAAVRVRGGFQAVIPVTMRDDAPTPVQEAATARMRAVVEECSRRGRTLVVPLLIARGGIEAKIPQRLTGLAYAYRGEALLPHPSIVQWLTRQVEQAAETLLGDT